MNLESQLTGLREQSRSLSLRERAILCCRVSKQLKEGGEYQAACEALAEFWPDSHGSSPLEGLDPEAKAETLLAVGGLTGWRGSTERNQSTQELAKDLLTQSEELFRTLELPIRAAEVRSELALCYWREGAYNEARDILVEVIEEVRDSDTELLSKALLRRAIVEKTAGQYVAAFEIYREAGDVIEKGNGHGPRGELHNGLGTLLNCLGHAEGRDDYIDRSLVEFAAASFHFEQAGHRRYQACVDINLGFLFSTLGRYSEAHKHLDRARNLLVELDDHVHLAQVNDTRARTLLAEGRTREAERFARSAVTTLEKGDEQALLAEALTTHGICLARLGNDARSRLLLQRAIEVAERAGDLEGAGRAHLSLIEEMGAHTSGSELVSIYQSAADLLQRSQDPSVGKRLIACARKVIEVLGESEAENRETPDHSWEGFSFKEKILDCERALIERALRDSNGSVTRAARLLGFRHHQSLISLINSRHKELLKTRTAVRKRRRHIFSTPRKIKYRPVGPEPGSNQISILHAEDSQPIANLIGGIFSAEGWRVELSVDGDSALRKLTSDERFDLLLVDNELPGVSGLDLVKRTRKMTHRRRMPIIMLSGTDCETEAWRAGVDAFLTKPDQVNELPSTIARLLKIDLKPAKAQGLD
ncbi:MAG: two-component system, chemotaxis family, chemotaxis protein CheY [Blastocatellia bacterium]|jgi:CheY-like chemotaxis protein|nr:two-component system, chemotaxis family, chemotaxis protein CheY [Blastocatellia bacterium]